MTSTPRVAGAVRSGDVVHLDDGTAHTVHGMHGTPSTTASGLGGLTVTIRLTDGVLRVGAGVELDVERPE
ncbi:hypothetical protein [Streptomyces sp. NPDC001774]